MLSFIVSAAESGRTVLELLRAHLRISWSQARRLVKEQSVVVAGAVCFDPGRRVKRGQRLEVRSASGRTDFQSVLRQPSNADQPVIRFADAHVVVVDKPAGLTTMRHPGEAAEFGARGRKYLPATLAD